MSIGLESAAAKLSAARKCQAEAAQAFASAKAATATAEKEFNELVAAATTPQQPEPQVGE